MINIEGYWYSASAPHYPKPIPNVITQDEANKIFELIKIKEKAARLTHYRGRAHSRIDNSTLGSGEYETKEWVWPELFAEHYVRDNRVKPTEAFLNYIGHKS